MSQTLSVRASDRLGRILRPRVVPRVIDLTKIPSPSHDRQELVVHPSSSLSRVGILPIAQ